jgi:hypothetical protein
MNRPTIYNVLYVWGSVIAALIVFAILTGVPFAFESLWRC